jgi:hypothetical protein
LAINAAKDASDLVAKLRSYHAASQSAADNDAKKKAYKNYGLDLMRGKVVDEVKAGVLEPSMSKVKSLKSAVEACISIMRIDTMIKLDRELPLSRLCWCRVVTDWLLQPNNRLRMAGIKSWDGEDEGTNGIIT